MISRKQLSWGRSSVAFSLVVLLTPSYIKLMEQNPPSVWDGSKAPSITKKDNNNYFHGRSYEELNALFESAPWKAQKIVDHLMDPAALNQPGYRAVLFVGEPGTGKTTTALAIPYKAGWQCDFIRGPELQRSFRNKSTEELLQELYAVKHDIEKNKAKIVVIIDGLDVLLDHTHDSHYDTDSTSKAIQGFLDDMEGEDDFFFIGTMNNDTHMSEPMKNRFELARIMFPIIKDPVIKRNIFLSKFVTPRLQIHEECNNEFIDSIVSKLGNCPPRSYENMSKEITRILYHENPNNKVRFIEKRHFLAVADALLQARQDMKIGEKEETDMQQRERHHKENLEHQRKLHDENMNQQKLHHKQSIQANLEIQAHQIPQQQRSIVVPIQCTSHSKQAFEHEW